MCVRLSALCECAWVRTRSKQFPGDLAPLLVHINDHLRDSSLQKGTSEGREGRVRIKRGRVSDYVWRGLNRRSQKGRRVAQRSQGHRSNKGADIVGWVICIIKMMLCYKQRGMNIQSSPFRKACNFLPVLNADIRSCGWPFCNLAGTSIQSKLQETFFRLYQVGDRASGCWDEMR